jgi:hypothetical protein
VNGTDSLPKCAVPIYGTGGLHRPGHIWNSAWNRMSEASRETWMRCLEPVGYAFAQRSPVLHINGTNDFFGGFDVAAEILTAIPRDWRCDYTPNANHAFDDTSTMLMNAWFEHYLRGGPPVPPAPPATVIPTSDRMVRVTTSGDPDLLTLWFSCGNASHGNRCWRPAQDWQRDGCRLVQDLAVTGDTWLYVRERHPEHGFTISSTPVCLSMPEASVRPQRVLFDGRKHRDGWGYQMTIEPQGAASFGSFATVNSQGLTMRPDRASSPVVFFGLGDPANRPTPQIRALEVDVTGATRLSLQCITWIGDTPYTCNLSGLADGRHRVARDAIKRGDEEVLPDFHRVGYLVVSTEPRPGESVRIRRLAWAS